MYTVNYRLNHLLSYRVNLYAQSLGFLCNLISIYFRMSLLEQFYVLILTAFSGENCSGQMRYIFHRSIFKIYITALVIVVLDEPKQVTGPMQGGKVDMRIPGIRRRLQRMDQLH